MSPSIVTATVEREFGAHVGLTLKSSEKFGHLLVDEIDPEGPFFGSALRVDMEVKTINNVDCSILSVVQATKLLERESFVTILATEAAPLKEGSLLTVTLVKPSADSKVGIAVGTVDGVEGICVADVRDGSLASTSKLRPGMLVVKINNADITSKSPTDAIKIMMETVGPLTFLVYTPYEGAGPASVGFSRYSTATVDADLSSEKEDANTKIGLDLTQDECGKVKIDRVDPMGPFCGTALRAGMEIVQVNGTDCTSCEHVTELMKESSKPVTLLAFKAGSRFAPGTLITAVLTKENQDTKLGIRFGMKNDTPIVSTIKDGSPAALTDLDTGMIIHSINNKLCAFMSVHEVTQTLVNAEGAVTILAEVPHPEEDAPLAETVSYVTATMQKDETDGKVGMKFGERGSRIVITDIGEETLAASTDLRVGMEVLTINNVDLANEKVSVAAALLAATKGHLTVVAKRPSLPAGSLVTGALKRESTDIKWGAKIGFSGKNLVVKGIYADSPAAASDLEPGMLVRSINNVDAGVMKASNISEIFSNDSLLMTIMAETTKETNMVCPSHIASVRSIRGLIRAPEPEPEPEPVEEEDSLAAADDDVASLVSIDEVEVLDADAEIRRLRELNAALMAKLAKETKTPEGEPPLKAAKASTPGPFLTTPALVESDSGSSDDESLPSSLPVEKVQSTNSIFTWYTSEGIQEAQVTNEIEC